MMFTLDTPPEEIIQHPQFKAPQFCRSTIRANRFADASMREFLARPVQMAIVDSCNNLRSQVWHLCDDELKTAVLDYLERANG